MGHKTPLGYISSSGAGQYGLLSSAPEDVEAFVFLEITFLQTEIFTVFTVSMVEC